MPLNITIDARELAKLEQRFGRRSEQMKNAINRIIKMSTIAVSRGIKLSPQFKHPTGRLLNSIIFEYGNGYGNVGPEVHYAKYVNYGTRYITANPFIQRGVAAAKKDITEITRQEVRNALNI